MEPLPPVKEVEYRCILSSEFDDLAGMEYTTFSFETAKEFSNFRYEIAVRYKIGAGQIEFKVLGMTATRTMMPSYGTAKSKLKVPQLPFGIYNLLMIKSDGTENLFTVELSKKGFQILPPVPRKRFIDVIVAPHAVMPGARLASTVSKSPPAPLIPRTIQKRQAPNVTAEEQAILDAIRAETMSGRDSEDEEFFGPQLTEEEAQNPDRDRLEQERIRKAAEARRADAKPIPTELLSRVVKSSAMRKVKEKKSSSRGSGSTRSSKPKKKDDNRLKRGQTRTSSTTVSKPPISAKEQTINVSDPKSKKTKTVDTKTGAAQTTKTEAPSSRRK